MLPPCARFISHLTLPALREHLSCAPTPLHVGQSLTTHWAARQAWRTGDDFRAIRTGREDREVEIEVGKRGRGYLDPDFQRIHMGLGLFLDAFILDKIPSSDPASLPVAYLAQSDLLDDPALAADVPALDVFKAGPQATVYRRTLWIGPRGSFTPFHRDPYIGLYSQVIGSKTFYVLPPEAAPLLDPSTDPRHTNTSTIPIPVSSLFPNSSQELQGIDDIPPRIINRSREKLEEAFKLPGASTVSLQAGESVLVPEGWWHSAEGGDTAGIGVGAWFR
ncbi:hypothetical protein DB88DRAFT_489710 [Papiliotrema laurentii]|uniref:JmjC domain-containing protein n=1 Tax=Papiliotrema laurentii TaxID=5418 RepID=A0AAD9CYE6_PAPLA|nr:hypothetical protein DB88DRAFT_489710 [Papiliotrema laurentii]